ncbi:hypothetical protein HPT25_01600 [Bacillus sp. BRMEA1]|uniref:hypothetical protein n=1 Tax=Neobacillus endophyticus TaxID=2738405 RepID=UPI00156548B5|nr:hypothetical protein [Neobacillus endophyticus]NRD76203.1 hypothetical protein [Neobacillus endophyticus]
MNVYQEDFRRMLNLLEQAVKGEIECLKGKSGPYNKGLMRGYKDVLEMIHFTRKKAS